MQHATFALTAILIVSRFTSNPKTMLSVDTLVLSLIMMAITFCVHATFYEYGQSWDARTSEHVRILKRSLWILAGIASLLLADKLANTSENETWIIGFLFLTGMSIWEFLFYLISEAPIRQVPRKNNPRKSH